MIRNNISKLALSVIFSLSTISQVDAVDLDPKQLFHSYSSGSAGTYDTSQGRYWHGGSFTGRVQQTSTDAIRFSPPSINAGCNGIDIFAGSFGLISGDELVQVARGAAQGASLYFFNLAMGSVCPSCKEVMDTISQKIEEMNKWGRNSCEAFSNEMDNSDLGRSMKGGIKSMGAMLDSAAGNANDWFTSLGDLSPSTSAGGVSNSVAKLMVNQNLIHNSLTSTYNNITFSSLGITGVRNTTELIQSLFGTIITKATEGAECATQRANDEECITTDNIRATLKLESFVFGTPATAGNNDGKILQCAESESSDPECIETTTVAVDSGFKGLLEVYQGYIKDDDGIIATIQRKDTFDSGSEQLQFINSNRYPWVKIATHFKGGAADGLADILALTIAQNQIRDVAAAMRGVMAYSIMAAQEGNKPLLKKQAAELLSIFDKQVEALDIKMNAEKENYKSILETFAANMNLNNELKKG